jgi:hypothetical protein
MMEPSCYGSRDPEALKHTSGKPFRRSGRITIPKMRLSNIDNRERNHSSHTGMVATRPSVGSGARSINARGQLLASGCRPLLSRTWTATVRAPAQGTPMSGVDRARLSKSTPETSTAHLCRARAVARGRAPPRVARRASVHLTQLAQQMIMDRAFSGTS